MSSTGFPPPAEYYDVEDGINVCMACGNPRFTLLHRVEHFGFPFEFFRCECGLIKQAPMPNEQFFEWFFNSDLFFSAKESDSEEIWGFYDYFKDENSRLKTSRRRFRILQQKLNWETPRSIMKIGPSTGTFLYVASQAGHQALGCDVSDQFVNYAKEHYQVQIDHGRFEHHGYADGQFTDLLLFNVIENVPNLDEFIAAIRRTLRVGGHFIFNHVEMRKNMIAAFQKDKYFIFRPPICYAFEDPALKMILEKHGFEIQLRFRDIRYLHAEKITTLLRWRWALKLSRMLKIERVNFPIWAYPSWITVARRVS